MKAKFCLLAAVLLAAVGAGFGQPVITQQPQSCTNLAGTTATFTVQATGTPPLVYQWQGDTGALDFSDLAARTSATLVLTNVGAGDAVDYRVILTDTGGAVTSAVASLTVLVPPRIVVQPTNFPSISLGVNLGNRVVASGSPPPAYQWFLNGTPLPGQIRPLLNLTNPQLSDAGAYTVVVTNLVGSVTSQVALLAIDPTFTKITTGALVTDIARRRAGAWGDYDNDGYPDFFVHECDPGPKDVLYRNNGDGTFTRLVVPSLQGQTQQNGGFGAAWGDFDNDGYLDLFVANYGGKNVLFRNRGDGTFAKVLTAPSTDGADSCGVAWGDYDRDGYLDLFVVNGYVGQNTDANLLYHNQGDGTFVKMTAAQVGPIVGDLRKWVLGSWVDYDGDGWLDMCVPNGNNLCLYRNLGGSAFASASNTVLGTVTWPGLTFAWADYDNDGRLDLFVGLDGTHPSVLYHQEANGTFKKMTAAEVGPVVSDTTYFGGVAWGDYDNDGFLDLFVAGGWLDPSFNYVSRKSFLYHNDGDGTFTRVGTGSPANDVGYSIGAYWVDYNRDGSLDLLVTDYVSANRLYRNNNSKSNNWLCVNCVGTSSPRFGTGAKVRAKATIRGKEMWQLRLIDSGGTCWGGQSFTAHFGLGDATNVDVLRIEWTSGIVQELYNVPAKQYLTVTEPARLSMPSLGELHIQCWKGMAYRIDGSPDLSAWTPLATVTNLTGMLQWTDPDAPGQSARFYRAVKQ